MGSDPRLDREFFVNYPVKIVRAEPKGRIIALSDVHGRDDLFEKVMEKVALCPDDMLIIVGDIIERGKYSLRALRRAMKLNERENTYVLMGNMDAHKHWQILSDIPQTDEGLLFNRNYYGASLFFDMCRELGLPCETVEDVKSAKPAVREHFKRELDFMGTCPTILDTPNWRFVHGGIPTNDIDSLAGLPNMCLKFDDPIGRVPVMEKPLVVGHYPTNLYWKGPERVDPYWDEEKRVLCIDGGCGLRVDAQLNAVILNPDRPGEFTYVEADEFPRARALDVQTGKAPTLRLCWPDSEAEILSTTPLSAEVRQIHTGIVTHVPIDYLEEKLEGGLYWINDCSDAELDVAPGDELVLIRHTEKGWYVGCNCLRGWYFGRIERTQEDA